MNSSSRMRALRLPVALVGAVLAGLAIMYWPMLRDPSSMKFAGISDSWIYTGAVSYYTDASVHAGQFPFWNPLLFCGQPIAGNPQYLLYYPPQLIRSLLNVTATPWGTVAGIAVMAVAHVIFAALGAYGLGRVRGLSRAASALAGCVFVFSAAMTQRYFMHHHMVFVVAWLPWCLTALDGAMHAASRRDAFTRYVGLGALFGMSLLAGFPETTYFVAFAIVLYWVVSVLVLGISRDRNARLIVNDVVGGALAVAVALGVAAALVAPAVEFMWASQRFSGGGDKLELAHGLESASFLEAMLFYPGGESLEGVKGVGAVALLLCACALFSRQRANLVLFGALAAFLASASRVDSAVMHYVIGPLSPFPISSPGRIGLVAALPIAMLAGLGLDRLRTPVASPLGRLGLTGAVGGLALFSMATLYAMSLVGDGERGFPILRSIPFVVLGATGVAAAVWGRRGGWGVAVVLVALLAEPLYWQHYRIAALASRPELFSRDPANAMTARATFSDGNTRESVLDPNAPLYRLVPQINGYDPLQLGGFGELVAPEGDTSFYRGVVDVARWSDRPYLFMKRAFWLHSEAVVGELPPRGTLFPAATSVYLSDPPSDVIPTVAADEVSSLPYSKDVDEIRLLNEATSVEAVNTFEAQVVALALPSKLPALHRTLRMSLSADTDAELNVRIPQNISRRVSALAGVAHVEAGEDETVLHVPLPEGAYERLEIESYFAKESGRLTIRSADLIVDRADESEQIHVLQRTANRVSLEVRDLPAPRVLSYIDFAYPGWRVYVDGQEAPLLRAFTHFKAVELPPGTHRVEFVFRPLTAFAGVAVSVVSVLAVAFVFVAGRRRLRAAPQPVP